MCVLFIDYKCKNISSVVVCLFVCLLLFFCGFFVVFGWVFFVVVVCLFLLNSMWNNNKNSICFCLSSIMDI